LGAVVFYRLRRLARLLKIQFEVITLFVPSITGFGSFTTFYEKNFQKHKNSRTFALANKQPFSNGHFYLDIRITCGDKRPFTGLQQLTALGPEAG